MTRIILEFVETFLDMYFFSFGCIFMILHRIFWAAVGRQYLKLPKYLSKFFVVTNIFETPDRGCKGTSRLWLVNKTAKTDI